MILYNGDEFETIGDRQVCEHHKKYPRDLDYAVCTCSASYTLHRKEIDAFRRRRNIGQNRLLTVLNLNAGEIRRRDLRLGQAILNAVYIKSGNSDIFYIEDDELANAVEEYMRRIK